MKNSTTAAAIRPTATNIPGLGWLEAVPGGTLLLEAVGVPPPPPPLLPPDLPPPPLGARVLFCFWFKGIGVGVVGWVVVMVKIRVGESE